MPLTPAQLAEYRERGYVVIDAPFPAAMTRACLDAAARHAHDPAAVAKVDTKQNHFTLMPLVRDSYFSNLDHSLTFLRVALHDEVAAIARQIYGDNDIYFRNGGINELAPRRSTGWHFDAGYEYVEFMHYFSGSTIGNGCLRVVPGSHKRPATDHLIDDVKRLRQAAGRAVEGTWLDVSDVALPGEVPLELTADKLIVRSSQLFHATHVNTTPRGRLMHHWLFRPVREGGFRFNWRHYLAPELLAGLTPAQRTLLRLEHDDPIHPHFQGETQRERGKAVWGVV